jgi:predicted dehydrogenase
VDGLERSRGGHQRVGIIGCGSIARWHVQTLLAVEEADIVSLVDPSEATLAQMRRAFPSLAEVPSFATAEELYAAVDLDAVEINTPHTVHYAQVIDAIERGLHVLCEKPLACSPEHAREVARRAAASGLIVTVSYQRRVDPAYRYMRRAIESGELGEIRAANVVCGQHWKKATAGSWRQVPELSGGGMLMDSGSHLVDVLLWLVGQAPIAVAASVDDTGAPVDINTTAMIRFANGAQGQLTIIGDLPTTWIESVIISGTLGVLRYETEPQHPWRTGRLLHYRGDDLVQPLNLDTATSPDAAWLAAIAGQGANPAPPEEGVRVAELTAAIYRAAHERRPVDLVPPPADTMAQASAVPVAAGIA